MKMLIEQVCIKVQMHFLCECCKNTIDVTLESSYNESILCEICHTVYISEFQLTKEITGKELYEYR